MWRKILNTPVGKIESIGTAYSSRLSKLRINTLEDLLYHFPTRYNNLERISKLNSLAIGDNVSVEASIWEIKNIRTKYGKLLTLATINDGTSSIECVWFNQPYLTKSLKPGTMVGLSGKVGNFNNKVTMISPDYEYIRPGKKPIHTSGIVPIYPETRGVSSKWLRNKLRSLLDNQELSNYEFLPDQLLKRNKLSKWYQSLQDIHFPDNASSEKKARERFAFEELFLLQLSAQKRKKDWSENKKATPLATNQADMIEFISNLPFELTKAQNRVIREIMVDLNKDKPMNRLLQGDVGSGKTVVAAIASYITIRSGFKVVLMAPTEILANQHYQTLVTLLKQYGIRIGLWTGVKKSKGEYNIFVGTHALIASKEFPKNIGLVIVDEQHKFGVEQRAKLRSKGASSHFLTMSATPIPRTMALTLYGDLDLSIIDELPIGRKEIKTYVVPKQKRNKAYDFIRKQVLKGRQVFIICPLIEPSETLESVRSAKEEWERLDNEIFPEVTVDLLHGRMKSKEKNNVLNKFKAGRSSILVSTPIVEVGIDMPNASVMMIEASERFGLSQLHQIRGRVGRGDNQSYCLLFTESENKDITHRLKLMKESQLGLQLAELDLKLRGPGQLYGTAQHGLPSLKVADFWDTKLINKVRDESINILDNDPLLKSTPLLREKILKDTVAPD